MNQDQLSSAVHSRHVVATLKKQKRKESEDHTEDVKMKELLELSDQFYEEFAESTFYRCTKA